MRKIAFALTAALLIALLTACNGDPAEIKNEKTEVISKPMIAKMEIDPQHINVTEWKEDGSHHVEITGRIITNGKPVSGAKIQNSERRIIETGTNGEFSLTADSNILAKNVLKVMDANNATVSGKKLDEKTKESLLKLEKEILFSYPIVVDKVETNNENPEFVDVYAKAQVKEGEKFPKFGSYKYRVGGTIKDYQGNPVAGATVNLRRDGVEGFSMSDPSDENGVFAMFYIPEDDENHYFYVQIPSKGLSYTLPENRAFLFPDDTGVNINIRLPETGTVINDTLENLVATTESGSLYRGVLIGVHTNQDYKITIPERDGSFKLTISKSEWEKNPRFYEINYQGFHEEEITSGDPLSSTEIPKPGKYDPSNILPIEAP
jgi:hypothetical protein